MNLGATNTGHYDQLGKDSTSLYVDSLIRTNPGLIEAAIYLHQSGQIPPNTYILDLDAHRRNAKAIFTEAKKCGISLYYMSKQAGRNPLICKAVLDQGFGGLVTVEPQEAKTLYRYALRIGHIGHLAQAPVHDIDYFLGMEPEVWTVYGIENARLISERAQKKGRKQQLLVQVIGKDDFFLPTSIAGIPEDDALEAVRRINSLPNVQVAGTTSFPCLAYDVVLGTVRPLPNFYTAVRVAKMLREELGIAIAQINVPLNNHASSMKIIAENGGTHAEPGTAVSGGYAWQQLEQQFEIPAVLYVSEVSHWLREKLFAYGGGTAFAGGSFLTAPNGKVWVGGSGEMIDALVGSTLNSTLSNRLKVKYPGTEPFNYNLTLFPEGKKFAVGETVLIPFAPQIFVTRAWHAVVEGIESNNPRLIGIFDQASNLIDTRGRLQGEQLLTDLMNRI